MKKTLILISIPIAIIIFSTIGLLITTNTSNRIVKKENNEYDYYLGKTIYGTDVATLINKATNDNEPKNTEK